MCWQGFRPSLSACVSGNTFNSLPVFSSISMPFRPGSRVTTSSLAEDCRTCTSRANFSTSKVLRLRSSATPMHVKHDTGREVVCAQGLSYMTAAGASQAPKDVRWNYNCSDTCRKAKPSVSAHLTAPLASSLACRFVFTQQTSFEDLRWRFLRVELYFAPVSLSF